MVGKQICRGCLAAYLVRHKVLGNDEINVSVGQGYEINRPSELLIKASVLNNQYSIEIGGRVIEVAEGELKL